MILNALANYYDRLAADPDEKVAPYPFRKQNICYALVLRPDGTVTVDDIRMDKGGKPQPKRLIVPYRKTRTSGAWPNFLWDNTGYVLGRDAKGDEAKTRRKFELFKEFHNGLANRVRNRRLDAVCVFLNSWDCRACVQLSDWEDVVGKNVIFRLQGERSYVHQDLELMRLWTTIRDEYVEFTTGVSLMHGKTDDIAKAHPLIDGVSGAKSSGAALISFDDKAFCSYGKDSNCNGPVGLSDAFRYATALNELTRERDREVRVGDTTVVFWSERPTPFEDDFGPALDDTAAEDQETLDRLRGFFSRLLRALEGDKLDDADVPFYVLGLAPNAARLSVRFWMAGTVQQFAEKLGQHVGDLEMCGAHPDAPPLTTRRILDQTARERKDVQPLLEGEVVRAVLTGGPYPQSLCSAVLRRIRADGHVNHPRTAILKAYLIRKARTAGQEKEIPVSLDKDNPSKAYQLGRLFAVLEKTQVDAHRPNKLNKTIVESYISSASASPGIVFPRLLSLNRHHLNKLPTDPGEAHARRCRTRGTYQQWIELICGHIDPGEGFPHHLPLGDQGRFFIGYYHQRQDFFTKKSDSDNDTNSKENNE